jgi:hypothetical protein
MKHPFFTLYYTGLGILVSIILMVGLFAANFSNLASIFTKDRPEPAPYNKETNTKIFKDFSVDEVKPDRLPVKPKVQTVTKEVSTPPQQSVASQSVSISIDTSKKELPTAIDSLK